ncbi:MAG: hypothetical protein GYA21_07965 [Myxococcales bacterium]|nr:hypothetical protein [Myxococcales bacterium]
MTYRFSGLIASGMFLLCCSCSGGAPLDLCSNENPCREGMTCNPEQECVSVEPLEIVTEFLPKASVGTLFEAQLAAQGGLQPYRWRMDSPYSWLTLDEETGVLRGTPTGVSATQPVTITVTDSSYGAGRSRTRQLPLSVAECESTETKPCHVSEEGVCRSGLRLCVEGVWTECTSTTPSADLSHCDASCSACPAGVSDRCAAGMCRCGNGPVCSEAEACCESGCQDLDISTENCGECGHDCDGLVKNGIGVLCDGGRCDYEECQPGFLDCDGDRENGCEQEMDAAHCGGCETSCLGRFQNVEGVECLVTDGGFVCAYRACRSGYLDCDNDPDNGCEQAFDDAHCGGCRNDCSENGTNRACVGNFATGNAHCGCREGSDCQSGAEQCCDDTCVSMSDDAHCGSCALDCASGGLRCVSPTPGELRCGCLGDGDCAGGVCCNFACRPQDDENCGGCDRACGIGFGGPHCDVSASECYCEDDGECRDFVGSYASCAQTDVGDRCACGPNATCQGGAASQCCRRMVGPGQWRFECVDTASDPAACGRCDVYCIKVDGTLGQCHQGGCAYGGVNGKCPRNSPAPDAVEGQATGYCVCATFGAGNGACPGGRYCCDGSAGGQGGPEGAADRGCCVEICGQNVPGGCIFQ